MKTNTEYVALPTDRAERVVAKRSARRQARHPRTRAPSDTSSPLLSRTRHGAERLQSCETQKGGVPRFPNVQQTASGQEPAPKRTASLICPLTYGAAHTRNETFQLIAPTKRRVSPRHSELTESGWRASTTASATTPVTNNPDGPHPDSTTAPGGPSAPSSGIRRPSWPRWGPRSAAPKRCRRWRS
jgi:hypothetical protein